MGIDEYSAPWARYILAQRDVGTQEIVFKYARCDRMSHGRCGLLVRFLVLQLWALFDMFKK